MGFFEHAANFTAQGASWAFNNPAQAGFLAVGAAGAVVAAAPVLVAAPAVAGLGFTASGIQAGPFFIRTFSHDDHRLGGMDASAVNAAIAVGGAKLASLGALGAWLTHITTASV